MRRVIDKFLELCDRSEYEMFQKLTGKPDSKTSRELFWNTEKAFAILQFKWLYAATCVFAETLDDIERRLEHVDREDVK